MNSLFCNRKQNFQEKTLSQTNTEYHPECPEHETAEVGKNIVKAWRFPARIQLKTNLPSSRG